VWTARDVLVLAAPVLLALFLLGTATPGTSQEVSIKVLVNDDPISDYDIDQRERFLAISTQQQPSPALKKQATDMLIDERLQMQEARKASISVDENDVTKILTDMAQKNNLDVDGLTTALARTGVNIKTLRDRIRAQIAWQETVRQKFRHDVQIGDADINKAMSQSGEQNTEGAQAAQGESGLQLRQVRFEIPAGADQATIVQKLAAAEGLRAKVSSCADLAKGVTGGNVRTLDDQKPSALAQPARLLVTNAKVGQMTPPVIGSSAIELYAVCGKRSFQEDDKARLDVQRKLMNEEYMLRAERFLRDMRQEAFIEYR
jgi:peptidyl-prolyl cis-trans isomerase SurA